MGILSISYTKSSASMIQRRAYFLLTLSPTILRILKSEFVNAPKYLYLDAICTRFPRGANGQLVRVV
jgi:hypothetical protein